METKIVLIKLLKIICLTCLVIFVINVLGVLIEYFKIIINGDTINSFEYRNFRFFINGNESYNQFSKKYLLFNLGILMVISIISFKKNGKIKTN